MRAGSPARVMSGLRPLRLDDAQHSKQSRGNTELPPGASPATAYAVLVLAGQSEVELVSRSRREKSLRGARKKTSVTYA
jgi:hypothetical protein